MKRRTGGAGREGSVSALDEFGPLEFRCIKFMMSNETDFLSQTWSEHVHIYEH